MERHVWNSENEVCSFLGALIKMTKAEKVLEIGTFQGESTVEMAAALPAHGRLTTVDIESHLTESNGKKLGKSKCHVQIVLQDGTSFMAKHEPNFFDLVFVDSMHHWDHILPEWKQVERVVKVGGLIAYHDSIHIEDVKRLMDYAEHHRYSRVDLMTPEGRGLTLLRRK